MSDDGIDYIPDTDVVADVYVTMRVKTRVYYDANRPEDAADLAESAIMDGDYDIVEITDYDVDDVDYIDRREEC